MCRDVRGSIWSDCYCLDPGVTEGGSACESGGTWKVKRTGPLAQNQSVSFDLVSDPGNQLDFFDPIDVQPDDSVVAIETLTGASDFTGTFDMQIGSGAPNDVPVQIVSLNLSIVSLNHLGVPTGPNSITLGPGGSSVIGSFDEIAGIIRFDDPVPCVITNLLFPFGLPCMLRPIIEEPVGEFHSSIPSAVVILPPALPLLGRSILPPLVLVLCLLAGAVSTWRRRETRTAGP